MKRLILALCTLVTVLYSLPAVATAASAEIVPKCQVLSDKYTKHYVTKRSNVRDAPNTNGNILATLSPGSIVYTNEATRRFPRNTQGWYALLATKRLAPIVGCIGGYIHPGLVSKTPPLQAVDSNHTFSLEEARRAVWKMHNPSAPSEYYSYGTATFITPRMAVTNYHVLMATLLKTSPQDITLSQEGSDKILRIRRVLVVSSVYDLVLFETTTASHGYLELAVDDEIPLEHLSQLTLLGYPKGAFRIMKQMDQTQALYENGWTFSIALDASNDYRSEDSKGNSGGPIINSRGQIVGIASEFSYNLVFGVKLRHLKDLTLSKSLGRRGVFTRCTDFEYLGHCFEAESEKLHKLAQQGNALAQHILSYRYGESQAGIAWMRRAAENGFADDSLRYAHHLREGASSDAERSRAFGFALRAAEQNLATAQTLVAKMFLEGDGTRKNRAMAINWLERAAAQGLNTALKALHGH